MRTDLSDDLYSMLLPRSRTSLLSIQGKEVMGYKIKRDKADDWFSKYVRLLAMECRRCHSEVQLNSRGDPVTHQASHFQGRASEATRFDLENVDCLCAGCHARLTAYPSEHVAWQLKTKGKKVVDAIVLRSNGYKKKDRVMEAMIWKQAYQDLKKEKL